MGFVVEAAQKTFAIAELLDCDVDEIVGASVDDMVCFGLTHTEEVLLEKAKRSLVAGASQVLCGVYKNVRLLI